VSWTAVTPAIRPIIAGAWSGSSAGWPTRVVPVPTVSMFVPRRSIWASRPAWEEADRPRTATMAATPIAMPRADSAARSLRVRSPVPSGSPPTRVGHPDGHGLGLSIVRAIAAAHDAELKTRLRPGGGLTIEAHLP
jgi:hypothetical protein